MHAEGRLRTTGLLGVVTLHAVIYVLAETAISHAVVAEVEDCEDRAEGGEGDREAARQLARGSSGEGVSVDDGASRSSR